MAKQRCKRNEKADGDYYRYVTNEDRFVQDKSRIAYRWFFEERLAMHVPADLCLLAEVRRTIRNILTESGTSTCGWSWYLREDMPYFVSAGEAFEIINEVLRSYVSGCPELGPWPETEEEAEIRIAKERADVILQRLRALNLM